MLVCAAMADAACAQGSLPKKGDRELGQYLSSQCTTCHQITGQSTGGIPPIIAMPDDQFVALMLSYKEKHRENEAMQAVANRLALDEIEALAAYFGSLPHQPKVQ